MGNVYKIVTLVAYNTFILKCFSTLGDQVMLLQTIHRVAHLMTSEKQKYRLEENPVYYMLMAEVFTLNTCILSE